MTAPLLPVNVQRDEDAAFGAAWRRLLAALPEEQIAAGYVQLPTRNTYEGLIRYIEALEARKAAEAEG